MPRIRVNGAELHYESTGSGPEAIVLSHGLLFSGEMFRDQVRHLAGRYRVITYDHRGQGRSEVTPGGYGMDALAQDAAELVKALGVAPCHFAGLSMGGFVAMRLAAQMPELLRSCILLETSADPESPENVPRYRMLNLALRLLGARLVAPNVMPVMFGRTFLADPARAGLRKEWRDRLGTLRRSVHRAITGVIERKGIPEEDLGKIRVPTLVLVGEEDVATPIPKAERICASIPGSRLVRIPRAGHSSTIENPAAVNAAFDSFLEALRIQTSAGG
ncbi:MAG TPA: alpha/beta fold hydrolase [Candidatus Sulfotelmatobacter sp.]|nr:alpha/beta fold hydrolase [Candidatus Sulfotelmatobacter sp.]